MIWFIHDWFQVVVSRQMLSAKLRITGWSWKLVRKLLQVHEEVTDYI